MPDPLDIERRLADIAPDARARVELALRDTLETELAIAAAAADRGHSRSHDRSHSRTTLQAAEQAEA
jgi:hypothetical protein